MPELNSSYWTTPWKAISTVCGTLLAVASVIGLVFKVDTRYVHAETDIILEQTQEDEMDAKMNLLVQTSFRSMIDYRINSLQRQIGHMERKKAANGNRLPPSEEQYLREMKEALNQAYQDQRNFK